MTVLSVEDVSPLPHRSPSHAVHPAGSGYWGRGRGVERRAVPTFLVLEFIEREAEHVFCPDTVDSQAARCAGLGSRTRIERCGCVPVESGSVAWSRGSAGTCSTPTGGCGLWSGCSMVRGPWTMDQAVSVMTRSFPAQPPSRVRAAVADLRSAGYVEDADEPYSGLSPVAQQRYSRSRQLFQWMDSVPRRTSWDTQVLLAEARVALVGVGGAGCVIGLNLVRSDVGHLHCVDRDVVESSNLNRQILYILNADADADADAGRRKVDVAVRTLRTHKPAVRVSGEYRDVDGEEYLHALAEQYDVVVLAADQPVDIRYWTNRARLGSGTPWVHIDYCRPLVSVGLYRPGSGPCADCLRAAKVERLGRAGTLRHRNFAHTLRRPPSASPSRKPVVLAVADEWFPAHGGVSSLNRHLCKALAAERAQVFCLLPAFTLEELDDARSAHVELLRAPRVAGRPPRTALMRRPPLPDGLVPDVIVGHSRLTGQEAKAVAEDHFPAATRLHVVHMSPDEIEWFKLDRGDDAGERAESRTALELDLARGAELIVAVGPRLHARFRRDAHAVPGVPPVYRLDPGFDADNEKREPTPGSPFQVLVTGRLEDAALKGLDIAAQAVGRAVKILDSADLEIEILVRGAPAGTSAELREALLAWAAAPAVSATPRLFTTDSQLLIADLRRAVLLLMPSRAEGFGLAGLEAIEQGTPVLISGSSGLGMLLRETLPEHLAAQIVLPVRDDVVDAEVWGAAVAAVIRDLPRAFATAALIRDIMARQRTWGGAAKALLNEIQKSQDPDVPV